ncbi:type III pantothenate kinase [Salibacterium sp. K-3]
MIAVLNIGNTHIHFGLFQGKELAGQWRLSTEERKTEDEYGLQIQPLVEQTAETTGAKVEGAIISSVVPPVQPVIEGMCRKYLHVSPLVIGPGVKTGLNIRYENPREVGADRIVNAVAAVEEHGGPLITADFGTAATFCYIDASNRYIGGVIAPGLSISSKALYEHGSKLPRVEAEPREQIIGKNTVHAIQSGMFFGYAGQVDGIITRMKEEVKENPLVIATGGDAPFIREAAASIDMVDAFLTLKGLRYIYGKNKT